MKNLLNLFNELVYIAMLVVYAKVMKLLAWILPSKINFITTLVVVFIYVSIIVKIAITIKNLFKK